MSLTSVWSYDRKRRSRKRDHGKRLVLSPYGLDIVESCLTCKMRAEPFFCNLSTSALQTFENIKYPTAYPADAQLFLQGQSPRGIFVLCKGRVKLSLSNTDGKTLILRVAEPGEVLGLSATVSGKLHELSATTLEPCQVNFVKAEDFVHFVKVHVDACFKVAEQLSAKYNDTCRELHWLGLSADKRLAHLLLEWNSTHGQESKHDSRGNLSLTQDEIAQMIGASRETVTRLLTDWRERQIVEGSGLTLAIRDRATLRLVATP